jgi:hypothetical protein
MDALAIGVREATANLGLSIPGQIKLATRYDGNGRAGPVVRQPLLRRSTLAYARYR